MSNNLTELKVWAYMVCKCTYFLTDLKFYLKKC